MSKSDELWVAKKAAETEMDKARAALSEAQSRFAKARKKYERARDAWLEEAEKAV